MHTLYAIDFMTYCLFNNLQFDIDNHFEGESTSVILGFLDRRIIKLILSIYKILSTDKRRITCKRIDEMQG